MAVRTIATLSCGHRAAVVLCGFVPIHGFGRVFDRGVGDTIPGVLARPFLVAGMFEAILPVCLDEARLIFLEVGPVVSPFGFERALMFRTRAAFWGSLDASLACEADALVAIPFAPGVGRPRSRWVWLGDRGFRWRDMAGWCFLCLCFWDFSIDAFMFISGFVRRNGGGRRGGTTASGALPPSPGVAGDSPGSPVLGTLDCGL